jgi:hypothetical protein
VSQFNNSALFLVAGSKGSNMKFMAIEVFIAERTHAKTEGDEAFRESASLEEPVRRWTPCSYQSSGSLTRLLPQPSFSNTRAL